MIYNDVFMIINFFSGLEVMRKELRWESDRGLMVEVEVER